MSLEARWLRVIVLLGGVFGFIRLAAGQTRIPAAGTRPVTVADAINGPDCRESIPRSPA